MVTIKCDKLYEFMKMQGLTIADICKLSGVSKRQMNKILSGKLDFQFLSLVKLANFLEIPVDWLIIPRDMPEVNRFYV